MLPDPHAAPQAMMAIELPQPPRMPRRLKQHRQAGDQRYKPAPVLHYQRHTDCPRPLPQTAADTAHPDRGQ